MLMRFLQYSSAKKKTIGPVHSVNPPGHNSDRRSTRFLLNRTVGDRLLGDRSHRSAVARIQHLGGHIVELRKGYGGQFRVDERVVDAHLEGAAPALAAVDNRLRTVGPDALLQLVALRLEVALAADIGIYGQMIYV